MVLQNFWVSQNFSRILRVSQSRILCVMCVWQSRFFYESSRSLYFFLISLAQFLLETDHPSRTSLGKSQRHFGGRKKNCYFGLGYHKVVL